MLQLSIFKRKKGRAVGACTARNRKVGGSRLGRGGTLFVGGGAV